MLDATTLERVIESPGPASAPGRPPILRLQRLGGRIYLSGLLGDDATRAALASAAGARFGQDNVTVELRVEAGVARPSWSDQADRLLALLQDAGDGARLLLRGDTAVLAAPAAGPAAQRRLRDAVGDLARLHWRVDLPAASPVGGPAGGLP